ncbi:MAG: hypothetical protein K8H86_14245 [Ignavibacteriaceae bacterium]|nr:hypothetical protein [Ignavibacteriaceae bacterium]
MRLFFITMITDWQGIYNQDIVKSILSRLIESGRVPHAFLFYGTEGVGKDFTALRFAQLLNISNSGNEALNICRQIGRLEEPYLKFIFPIPRGKNETNESTPLEKLTPDDVEKVREEVAKRIVNPYHRIKIPKANNIKISSIRDIKKFVSLSFTDIGYRVIIISDAHLMNEEAQNALLKNLEEPPEGVIFILTTPLPALLRETIRSRCWLVHFQPLLTQDISSILIEHFGTDSTAANAVAPFCGGSIASAVSLLNHNFEALLNKTIHILRYSFGRKYHSALEEFSSVLSEGSAESVQLIIQMITTWFNDLQRYKISQDDIYFKNYPETLQKFNDKFPELELTDIIIMLDQLSASLKGNANLSTVVLNTICQLSLLTLNYKNKPTNKINA